MSFAEKLSLLLKTQSISNNELAQALKVDPSLVSRWRNGSRYPSPRSNYLDEMCLYFAKTAQAEYQRVALLKLIDLPLEHISDKSGQIAGYIYTWLCQRRLDDGTTLGMVDHFLVQMDLVQAASQLDQPEPILESSQGRLQQAECFVGIEGMRDAMLKLLHMLLEYDTPVQITAFSDQGLDWLHEDPAYSMRWNALMEKCLNRGHSLQIIHTLTRELHELFAMIESWLPLYMSGKIKTFYCPKYHEAIFKRTIVVVPGLASLTAHNLAGQEDHCEYLLSTDPGKLQILQAELQAYLGMCKPLMQIFTPRTIKQYQRFQTDFNKQDHDLYTLLYTFSSISMPESLFLESLNRLALSAEAKKEAHALFLARLDIFDRFIRRNKYVEIVTLPSPQDLDFATMPVNLAPYIGRHPIHYNSIESIRSHIRNIIERLNKYDNYRLYLRHQASLNYTQIMVKEDVGAVFTKDDTTFFTITLTQPTLTQAFYNYLENIARLIPGKDKQKKSVISQLESYL